MIAQRREREGERKNSGKWFFCPIKEKVDLWK